MCYAMLVRGDISIATGVTIDGAAHKGHALPNTPVPMPLQQASCLDLMMSVTQSMASVLLCHPLSDIHSVHEARKDPEGCLGV